MFKKKENVTPEEKLLKIIEEPHEKGKDSTSGAFEYKRFFKITLKAVLKKINFLDWTNRLLMGAGGVATVFLVFTIVRPMERPGLAIIPREDIDLLNTRVDQGLEDSLDSYLKTILGRNIFEIVKRGKSLSAQAAGELNLKLVGIISLSEDERQAIIEDKEGRTHLVNEGDRVLEQFLVEKIGINSVIVKSGEESVELK